MSEVIKAEHEWFQVTIELISETEDGKAKKSKEIHLVDAVNMSDAETKVATEMDGEMLDWKITKIEQSKISSIY